MRTRAASHAGSWYQSSRERLAASLQDWLDTARSDLGAAACASNLVGIIAPHAGYAFSGAAAGYAYAAINPQQYDTVFVLGPSHHAHLPNKAGLTAAAALETPLGRLGVDSDANTSLLAENKTMRKELFFVLSKAVDEDEHSIEMHLPYLRHVFGADAEPGGRVRFVPVMIGAMDESTERQLGGVLAKWLANGRALFVISTDFCHWGSRFGYTPYRDYGMNIWKKIEQLDHEGMNCVERCERNAFASYLANTQNTICGRYPVSALLSAIEAKRSEKIEIKFVRYEQSSKCQNRADSSVSYASAHVSVSNS